MSLVFFSVAHERGKSAEHHTGYAERERVERLLAEMKESGWKVWATYWDATAESFTSEPSPTAKLDAVRFSLDIYPDVEGVQPTLDEVRATIAEYQTKLQVVGAKVEPAQPWDEVVNEIKARRGW